MKNYPRKWNKQTISSISGFLVNCNAFLPTDIHRAMRSLDVLSYWKGVEFRTMLHYVGMVALRSALPADEYEHFLTLFCAVTFCSCEVYKPFMPMAKKMFNQYVKEYSRLYGIDSVGSNVHNLTHVTDDLEQNNIANLNKISTYKFENTLRLLGMKLQTCNRPLEQISRRLMEISNLNMNSIGSQDFEEEEFLPFVEYELLSQNSNYEMYSKINIMPDIFLSNRKFGDQWFLTTSDVVKMSHAVRFENTFQICGHSLIDKRDFFTKPLNSSKLNIFMSNRELHNDLVMYDIRLIKAKLICLPSKTRIAEHYVLIPLLHTLETLSKVNIE